MIVQASQARHPATALSTKHQSCRLPTSSKDKTHFHLSLLHGLHRFHCLHGFHRLLHCLHSFHCLHGFHRLHSLHCRRILSSGLHRTALHGLLHGLHGFHGFHCLHGRHVEEE